MIVAIFGSGPSGFYAAEELLKQTDPKIQVDMYDRLPTPFGLVRGGVAPDHPRIKSVTRMFDKTAAREGFRFFGNVEYVRDVNLEDLKPLYDAVIFAVGAKTDRHMGIPGEDLNGSYAATEFVGWYNGHPDYRNCQFDLSCEKAVVIGNGNVAVDVARILSRDPSTLEQTDIANYALEALKKSSIKEVYMLGRRGPFQSAFTNPEIRELCELPGSDLVAAPEDLNLDPLSQEDLEAGVGGTKSKGNVEILKEHALKPPEGKPRKITLKFLVSPIELIGKEGHVAAVKLEKNKLSRDKNGALRPHGTETFETLEAGLVLRSIGYKGVSLPGIPFNEKNGILPNIEGRIIDDQMKHLAGLYVVGWAKRGPSGVIGTNKPDSIDTVRQLLDDLKAGKTLSTNKNGEDALEFLTKKGIQVVRFDDWKKLDELEVAGGKPSGKPREKFKQISEMLAALKK